MSDDAKEFLGQRQRSYNLTFENESGKRVLEDLSRFCRANETTFHADPRVHAALEGRREVWLRIREHLDMAPKEFISKHTNTHFKETK